VNETPTGPTVLVADEDVGFIWWLAELLAEAGFRSIPALGCRQALSLVKSSGSAVELALVNPRLRGSARLVFILRHYRTSKIVAIQEPGLPQLALDGALTSIEKPAGLAPVSRVEWRQKLQRMLLQIGSRAAS